MLSSKVKIPGIRSERGGALLVVMLLVLGIMSIYYTITLVKRSNEAAQIASQKRKNLGVRCRKAIDEIRTALDAEKQLKGEYPYTLNNDFLDRYKTLDRYVFNTEIWSPHADNTVYLETTYGESYILTGYCRDGYSYSYDSIEDKIYTRSYYLDYNEEDDTYELKED